MLSLPVYLSTRTCIIIWDVWDLIPLPVNKAELWSTRVPSSMCLESFLPSYHALTMAVLSTLFSPQTVVTLSSLAGWATRICPIFFYASFVTWSYFSSSGYWFLTLIFFQLKTIFCFNYYPCHECQMCTWRETEQWLFCWSCPLLVSPCIAAVITKHWELLALPSLMPDWWWLVCLCCGGGGGVAYGTSHRKTKGKKYVFIF